MPLASHLVGLLKDQVERIEACLDDFRFHDLRHSTASYLPMKGTSLVEIADVLGHRTLQMVRRYAHLSESHVKGLMDVLSEDMFNNI